MTRKLTPKKRVLKRYQGAVAKQWSHAWCIERHWPPGLMLVDTHPLGEGNTPKMAWADAARKL